MLHRFRRGALLAPYSALGDLPTAGYGAAAIRSGSWGREVCEVELGGRRCRLLQVGGLRAPRGGAYGEGEITQFEFEGNYYALIADPVAVPAAAPLPAGEPRPAVPDVRSVLTVRELQIVQLVCMGYLTKQIAGRLHISEFTVRSYLKTIYCKLGVRSRAAMVFCYMQACAGGADGAQT